MRNEILKQISNIYFNNIRRNISKTSVLKIGDGAIYRCPPCESKRPAETKSTKSTKSDTSVTSQTSTMELKRECYPDKVRHGFIPEEWFTFFYEKTGVTGPYVFGVGLLNYLFSKEIYVCDHEFYTGLSLGIMCIVAVKKLGPLCAEQIDKNIDKIEQQWREFRAQELKELNEAIEEERKEQWRAEGNLILMEIKKQNIQLQLEAAYRKALWEVYQKVQKQLDYQVARANVQHRINHKNMVLWIIKEMTKQLPPTDQQTMEKLKGDISALAMRIK